MKFSLASSALSAVTLAAISSPAANAINFIVIQPDDMQFYDDWSPPPYHPWMNNYPGNPFPGSSTLPWINKLKTEGLHMTSAYAASPKCGTSRYSTVTGRYASRSSLSRRTGIREGKNATNPVVASIPNTKLKDLAAAQVVDGMDCSQNNLAQTFTGANFTTGMVGKWHLSKLGSGGSSASVQDYVDEIELCGFSDVEAMYPDNLDTGGGWAVDMHHNMEYVAYKSVEFIQANQNTDWFLYVNPTVPHGPSVDDAMNQDCMKTVDGDFSASGTGWSVKGMDQEFGDDCVAYRADVRARAANSDNDDDLGAIWVDDAIGAIYQSLSDTNQLDDTVIIFQLDHGKHKKDKIWEGGIRIPQFIHYPAGLGTAPRTFDGLVSTIDIGPTMLDFAGVTPTYSMDGKSWKDAIDNVGGAGDDWKANRCLFFESNDDRAVRCGCDKYMLLSEDSPEASEATSNGWPWSSTTEALFDLCDASNSYINADSSTSTPEENSILDSEPQKAADLRELLQCHLDRTDPTLPMPDYSECTGTIATPSPTVTPQPTLPVAPIDGAPELLDHEPLYAGLRDTSDNQLFKAVVLDDNIQNVRFNIQLPNGTRTGFSPGTEMSSSGDQSTWELYYDTASTGPGKYGYRIQMRDSISSQDVEIPLDGTFIHFIVADTTAEIIEAARDEIADIITEYRNTHSINLAAKFVRQGFHDCVGGCDGCLDMSIGSDNAGLDVPILALEPVVEMFAHHPITRADLWVLAALEGAGGSQETGSASNRNFDMDWVGRPNCEDINEASDCVDHDCSQSRGPHRGLPSPDLNTTALLEYFATEFDFDATDTTAIMGAHTLGFLARENSGFNGGQGWLGNTNQLGNGYYDDLIGGTDASDDFETLMEAKNWEQVFIDNTDVVPPNRWEWERNGFVMLNTDIGLVRDLGGEIDSDGHVDCQVRCNRANCMANRCPYAAQTFDIAASYKFDEALWKEDFEDAFKRMLNRGFDDSAGCPASDIPCEAPVAARRNLRKRAD